MMSPPTHLYVLQLSTGLLSSEVLGLSVPRFVNLFRHASLMMFFFTEKLMFNIKLNFAYQFRKLVGVSHSIPRRSRIYYMYIYMQQAITVLVEGSNNFYFIFITDHRSLMCIIALSSWV